jgi:hypothetical protein
MTHRYVVIEKRFNCHTINNGMLLVAKVMVIKSIFIINHVVMGKISINSLFQSSSKKFGHCKLGDQKTYVVIGFTLTKTGPILFTHKLDPINSLVLLT